VIRFVHRFGLTKFRTKLLAAMMLVIGGLTVVAVYLVQRNAVANAERDFERDFRSELASLDSAEELRHSALTERCHTLVLNPRLHAALEDNALDLLYPTAKDELREVMQPSQDEPAPDTVVLRANFYRFLDSRGLVIPPPSPAEVGPLSAAEESQLALRKLPQTQQTGYFFRRSQDQSESVDEVITLPIFSTETGDVISALVVGFEPLPLAAKHPAAGMRSGIWVNGRLYLPALSSSAAATLGRNIALALSREKSRQNYFTISLDGSSHLLFFRILNAKSLFPPAYQVCIYPLQDAAARQRKLQGRIVGAGIGLLAAGFVASHIASARLSRPVEKLAVESQTNLAERRRAEATLVTTSQELKRSSRFSADASHQLKSPLTVLRAGIESLLARSDFEPSVYDELSSLLHQTYRLTGVVDDLLLLSRMDAGRLRIHFSSVDLSGLVDEWLDDLNALPDAMDVQIEKHVPPGLYIAGEKRYTSLIVQNLVENARKYNRSGGRIRVTAREQTDAVALNVGNTGRTIPEAAQEHVFERFNRGGVGQNVVGHGLGLNLACELALLHGGELSLVSSGNDWTEFEVTFRPARHGYNGAHLG
jgi:signal transduction histidine kinase